MRINKLKTRREFLSEIFIIGGRGCGLVDNLNKLNNAEIVAACDNYELTIR